MTESLKLSVLYEGRTIDMQAEITSEEVSAHTGRQLRRAESTVQVAAQSSTQFRAALETSGATDADGNHWSGTVQSESYSNGGPRQFYIEWAETEELRAERVEFQGLLLTPTRYTERMDDDVLAVTLQATLSPEDAGRLRGLEVARAGGENVYWPVRRIGVSDVPRTMRLGQLLWSERPDGNIDYQITLVDAAQDERPQELVGIFSIAEPQLGQTMSRLLDIAGRFEALLELLEQEKTIDAEARKLLDEAGARARRQEHYKLYEVKNINDWWLDEG